MNPHSDLSTALQRIDRSLATQRVSWTRVAVTVMSYALLLSDTIRTGLTYAPFSKFPSQDVDTVKHFTPGDYPVVHATLANATAPTATLPLWLYKQDTTSIVMRGVVELLGVRGWSPCLLYDSSGCGTAEDVLPVSDVFQMIDALIDSVRVHSSLDSAQPRGRLTLRITSMWIDRLNDVVLPAVFRRTIKKNGRVAFLELPRDAGVSLCRPPFEFLACQDVWSATKAKANQQAQHGLAVITRRLPALTRAYPNDTLETVILEGSDDYSRGAFLYLGRSYRDLVMLTRVRRCDELSCTTIAVDDVRFEDGRLATSVADWTGILRLLRGTGQVYMWLRILLLLGGAFCMADGNTAEDNHADTALFWTRVTSLHHWRRTLHVFFLIPSQVVVYGSWFPIACYTLAHLMDCLAIQEVLYIHFISLQGLYNLRVDEVVAIGMVSLRSMWTISCCAHVLERLVAWRAGPNRQDVTGIPEFFVHVSSALVVFAQMRVRSWRNTKNLEVIEVPWSTALAHLRASTPRRLRDTVLSQLAVGVSIDTQFVALSLLIFSTTVIAFRPLQALFPRWLRYRPVMLSTSTVPLSAGTLWPTDAFVVSWYGAIVSRVSPVAKPPAGPDAALISAAAAAAATATANASPKTSTFRQGVLASVGAIMERVVYDGASHTLRAVPVLRRTPQDEALVALMNVAAMTDPLSLLRLRSSRQTLVALLVNSSGSRSVLLPWPVTPARALELQGLRLCAIISVCDVPWSFLVQCG
ncbi:hypothetical protein ATCC90586_010301 [Pythium insidiosum]|nr:hypothetical protein ATCC90586_010301 [Pythium insidiosum]